MVTDEPRLAPGPRAYSTLVLKSLSAKTDTCSTSKDSIVTTADTYLHVLGRAMPCSCHTGSSSLFAVVGRSKCTGIGGEHCIFSSRTATGRHS